MGPPGRNQPDAPAPQRVRQQKNTTVDRADCLPTFLAVVLPAIDPLETPGIRKDPGGLREAHAVLGEVGGVLGRIPLELHNW